MPAFFVQSLRSAWQAKSEIGCLAVAVLRDTGNAFWTRTVWENEDAMRAFMLSGVHQRGMHRLREWCDEASVVHWLQKSPQPPSWDEAHRQMQRDGLWLPFLDTYRTMCLAPQPDFRRVLEDVRAMQLAA